MYREGRNGASDSDHQPVLRRRSVLGLLAASAVGVSGSGLAAGTENDREVTEYANTGSIESPDELGEAITSDTLWDAKTSVSFAGDYGHAEVFTDQSLQGFPTDGGSFGIISTGVAEEAPGSPDTFASTAFFESGNNELTNPGSGSIEDASYITLSFEVPEDADTLSFSYRFATEEIPTYVGTQYQDFFAFQIEYPDGSSENVATLPGGEPVTVDNSVAYTSEPDDLIYNAVTSSIVNSVDISEYQGDELTITTGVADVGDAGLDSAVLLDNVGFDDIELQPEIRSLSIPPTAVETDEEPTFEVVVDPNETSQEEIDVSGSATLFRRGSEIETTSATVTQTENDDGMVIYTGSFDSANSQPGTAEGLEYAFDIEVSADGSQIGDIVTGSTFAFEQVDSVFGVAARPEGVTPESAVANENLRALLRDQGEYVNRHYASGLGSMGAQGFAFDWINRSSSSILEDDGYVELPNGYDEYDDGGASTISTEFTEDALDRCTDDSDVDYEEYDTAITTNGPYENETQYVFSRSFWYGELIQEFTIPVINRTIDLSEVTGISAFDTDAGTIAGIYAPLNEDTWVHEFGHSMGPDNEVGLPDLYDIDSPFQNFGDVRGWGLMGDRVGKVISSFCRNVGSDPAAADDGWLEVDRTSHIIEDVSLSLPNLIDQEIGDEAKYVLSAWGYVSVDLGLTDIDVETDWQFGIFLLEGRPGGDADFSSPDNYTPALSPDPFDEDGVALYEFGILDLDVNTDELEAIFEDIRNGNSPDIALEDAEAIDIDYVPPASYDADIPTLKNEGDTFDHTGAATTFELTNQSGDGSADVELRRDTGQLGDTYSLIVEVLESLENEIDGLGNSGNDPLPGLDVIAETSDGARSGFDPETGEIVNEIDGADVGGTVSRRRVTVPADTDVEFSVSAERLRTELEERGIEPPEAIEYEREILADDDVSLEERDGYPFIAGRSALKEETDTEATDTAVISVDIDISPAQINADSDGEFVTVELGFDTDITATDIQLESILLGGVQAIHDDQYGFVRNPPVEERDGVHYVTIKFPREEIINTIGVGSSSPQIIGRAPNGIFRGRGDVTVFEAGAGGNSSPNGAADSSSGNGSPGGNGQQNGAASGSNGNN